MDKKQKIKKNNIIPNKNNVRVGANYQAVCPEMIPVKKQKCELLGERALLMWTPPPEEVQINGIIMHDYIKMASDQFKYTIEQALAMLYYNKYNIDAAINQMSDYTPDLDEFTEFEINRFDNVLKDFEKDFRSIRKMFFFRSVQEIVNLYYQRKMYWKRNPVTKITKPKLKSPKQRLRVRNQTALLQENSSESNSSESHEMDNAVQVNKINTTTVIEINDDDDDYRTITLSDEEQEN